MKGPGRRFFLLGGLLVGVAAVGTIGFMALEGLTLFNALYLTVITITTVGYGDVAPVTTGGRVLAMLLVLVGFGTFTALVVTATQAVLERSEARKRTQQLGILIGLYFSELGRRLIRFIIPFDAELRGTCLMTPAGPSWLEADFDRLVAKLKVLRYAVALDAAQLPALKRLLDAKNNILLRMLESPNLLEHDLFLNVLRAAFHLRDELSNDVSPTQQHINEDLGRVYRLSAQLWIDYMQYLRQDFPALFRTSLAGNPFTMNESSGCED